MTQLGGRRISASVSVVMALLCAACISSGASAEDDDGEKIEIAKADVPQPWAVAPIPSDLEIECGASGQRCRLDAFMASARICALLIARDDRNLLEIYNTNARLCRRRTNDGGGPENSDAHLYGVASVTKSVTSTMLAFALQGPAGRIDFSALERTVPGFLSELGAGSRRGYEHVSLRQTLRMRSGVLFEEYGTVGSPYSQETMFARAITGSSLTLLEFLATLPSRPNGPNTFEYKAADTTAVGLIADRLAGVRLQAYLRTKLWNPLGMERRAKWSTELKPAPTSRSTVPFCCLKLGPRDLAKFGAFVLQRGVWRGKRLLDAAWFDRGTAFDELIPRASVDFNAACPSGYAFQWWTLPGADRSFMAKGKGGSFVHVFPSRGAVVVQISDWSEYTGEWHPDHECRSYHMHRSLAAWAARPR